MSIIVTGGAGYIGSHMTLALLDSNEQVVVIDNLSTGYKSAIPDRVPFYNGDIGDVSLIKEIVRKFDVQSVIHFAAMTSVPESVSEPLTYYDNNTIKTHALLSACAELGVKHFIFSSSAAVYGDTSSIPVTEERHLLPISPYGRSKLMVEWMLEDTIKATNISSVILRYFNVAGADPLGRSGQSTPHASHLIKVCVQAALGIRDEMCVFGDDYPTADGTCIRDYIQVSDLCQAHLDALRYLREGNRQLICNCGYGRGFSVFEIINAVRRVSGRNFKTRIVERRAGDLVQVVSDNSKIKQLLKWSPRYDDLDMIVGQAIAWEQHLIRHPMV